MFVNFLISMYFLVAIVFIAFFCLIANESTSYRKRNFIGATIGGILFPITAMIMLVVILKDLLISSKKG